MERLIGALLAVAILVGGMAAPALAQGSTLTEAQQQRLAVVLDRLKDARPAPLVPADTSCATSCGSGPTGSCSKSCPSPQSCRATCDNGKAVCRCD